MTWDVHQSTKTQPTLKEPSQCQLEKYSMEMSILRMNEHTLTHTHTPIYACMHTRIEISSKKPRKTETSKGEKRQRK